MFVLSPRWRKIPECEIHSGFSPWAWRSWLKVPLEISSCWGNSPSSQHPPPAGAVNEKEML